MKTHGSALVVILCLVITPAVAGFDIWEEGPDDDQFSDDCLSPTLLSPEVGFNSIRLWISEGEEYDTWAFTLPQDWTLEAIILTERTPGLREAEASFFFAKDGFLQCPPSVEELYGWVVLSEPDPADDLLPLLSESADRFDPPLGAGHWVWAVRCDDQAGWFGMDFKISPEPSSLLLLGAGSLWLSRRRR